MFALPLGDRAELRPLDVWRAGEFLANLDRCRDYISPWVGRAFVATDLDSARAVLRRYADKHAADAGGIWGIWLDGTLVGGILFVSFDPAAGVAEAGCWLEPSAVGHGLVTTAMGHLLDWTFGVRGLSRVEWRTIAGNERSIAVAKRLGMRLDGVLREVNAAEEGQPRRDDEIWSLLASEWRA
ncbi:GNAT family protein [Longispora sp. K20-0274]|uniref:GNAT family N-acetyltransferase n=1 Tax=Longispora sp. K20-0274 TaxID=3088255 RepID=UPI00399AF64C